MTDLKPECFTRHTKKKFVVKEQKSEVIFQNPAQHEIQEIRVDDCILTEGIRCDYLVTVDLADASVFVELKGADVKHAVEQLTRSHRELAEHCKRNKFWIVSTTRCPLTSTEIQNLAVRIRRGLGSSFED